MTAQTPELIPLIYRHLKEHGFTTAAEELQKLSPQPQEEAPTSTTLLEIYKNWIRNAKRRKKPATPQAATPNQKQTTPKRAAPRKKTDKTAASKPGSPSRKATPTRMKKVEEKTDAKVAKTKKNDDDGEGSDSDSSLDVEKWKKLVQEMTDTDLAKVEALNALAVPEPKKPRPRKPRAKPKPQTEAPVNAPGQQTEKPDKSTEKVTTKRSPKKAAPAAPLENLGKDQNSETSLAPVISTSKQTPKKEKRKASDQTSVEPTPKKKKETIQSNLAANVTNGEGKNINNRDDNLVTPTMKGQEHSPDLQTEPKKKKKKKEIAQNVSVETTDGVGLDKKKIIGNSPEVQKVTLMQTGLKEGSQENTSNSQSELKQKKKKKGIAHNVSLNATGGDGLNEKNITGNSTVVQKASLTKTGFKDGSQENSSNSQTEPKKKKKKAVAHEPTTDSDVLVKNVGSTLQDLKGNHTSLLNDVNPEAESTVKVKKKKKKIKERDDGNSQQTVTEAKTNSVSNEVICETTVEESISNIEIPKKKKKKDKHKDESETLQQTETPVIDDAVCVVENTDQIDLKKKSKKKKKQREEHLGTCDKMATTVGSEISEGPPDPPSTPQTPGPKKKKHKLDSEEHTKADTEPQTVNIETPKKKKKKASKSKETES